ncbi:MAG TPA: hypothetical protein VNZ58_07215 [Thermomicrobiales bacterium]|nr:hypothetical protein [Thermomicrobiales bacterium]
MPELNLQLVDPDSGDVLPQPELSDDDALALLERAEITTAELVPWGSNHTFAVALETDDVPGHLAIYKPVLGERPLWDFRHGSLYARERASYLLSRSLGWELIPTTVVREGPYGLGSVQIYVPSNPDVFEDAEFWGARTLENERLVLFDHIANNADRKITHCLLSTSGRVVGIDHGLTFHAEPKLRTVMWQFVGQPIRHELLADLDALLGRRDEIDALLADLLVPEEIAALWNRVEMLRVSGTYPQLDPRFNIPYGWW